MFRWPEDFPSYTWRGGKGEGKTKRKKPSRKLAETKNVGTNQIEPPIRHSPAIAILQRHLKKTLTVQSDASKVAY